MGTPVSDAPHMLKLLTAAPHPQVYEFHNISIAVWSTDGIVSKVSLLHNLRCERPRLNIESYSILSGGAQTCRRNSQISINFQAFHVLIGNADNATSESGHRGGYPCSSQCYFNTE